MSFESSNLHSSALIDFTDQASAICSHRQLTPPIALAKSPKVSAMRTVPTVFIVEDDVSVAEIVSLACELRKWPTERFTSAEALMESDARTKSGCFVVDLRLPGASGLELQSWLRSAAPLMPVILISGYADVEIAVKGMRLGALTLLQKPFDVEELCTAIHEAMAVVDRNAARQASQIEQMELVSQLSRSDRETIQLILAGKSNKQIAAIQGLSLRGVEDRRSRLMRHFGTRSLAEFVLTVQTILL